MCPEGDDALSNSEARSSVGRKQRRHTPSQPLVLKPRFLIFPLFVLVLIISGQGIVIISQLVITFSPILQGT
jgi:hypothetical protein